MSSTISFLTQWFFRIAMMSLLIWRSPFPCVNAFLLQITIVPQFEGFLALRKAQEVREEANKINLKEYKMMGTYWLDQSLIPDVYITIGLLPASSKIQNKIWQDLSDPSSWYVLNQWSNNSLTSLKVKLVKEDTTTGSMETHPSLIFCGWHFWQLPLSYLPLEFLRILQHLPLCQTLLMCFTALLLFHIILMMRAHLNPFGIPPQTTGTQLLHFAPFPNTRCETLDQFAWRLRWGNLL